MFNKSSSTEKGTLNQLKKLLHHTAVPLDSGDNTKAAEDFLEVVLHAHIVAAAKSGNLTKLCEAVINKFVKVVLPQK